MKKITPLLIASFFTFSSGYAETGHPVFDTLQIETLTGVKGELDSESKAFKVFAPRTDLKVSAAGVQVTPALGLTSWAAFKPVQTGAEVMGDLVLLEDQINFVMKEALDNGLNVTALHNQSLWENPRIMLMHVEGKGATKDIALAVGKTFEVIKKTSRGSIWNRSPSILNPARSTLNSKDIEDLLEKKGTLKDGVYRLTWGAQAQTWAAFAGTDRDAVMLGNIEMRHEEVQNVLKTLLKHNIFILSIHQHSLAEGSNTFVVHFMGRGPAFDLAKSLREILEQVKLYSAEKP